MTEYTVSVHTAMSGDCVPLIKVAEAMARRSASGHGMLPFHEPTFNEVWPRYVALLLDAARTGQLTICDNDGRRVTAEDAMDAALAPTSQQAAGEGPQTENDYDQLNLCRLYARSAHLVAWGNANGDCFKIIDVPVEVVELANRDRGMIGLSCQAGEQSTTPPETPKIATTAESDEPPAMVATPADYDAKLAALFDAVKVAQLEAMFPDRDAGNKNRWPSYVERANRNGLKDAAKEGPAIFNPYRAAVWWLTTGPKDWKLERCLRVLANNLPARSIDSKHMLTGVYE